MEILLIKLRVVGDTDPYKNNRITGTTGASSPTSQKSENAKATIDKPQKLQTIETTITEPQKSENVGATIDRPQNGKNVSYWGDVVNTLKQQGKVMLYTNLINTTAKEINDLTLGIEFPNGLTAFGKTVIEKSENMQELVKQVSIHAGKEMRIKLIDAKASISTDDNIANNGLSDLGIDINIINE